MKYREYYQTTSYSVNVRKDEHIGRYLAYFNIFFARTTANAPTKISLREFFSDIEPRLCDDQYRPIWQGKIVLKPYA